MEGGVGLVSVETVSGAGRGGHAGRNGANGAALLLGAAQVGVQPLLRTEAGHPEAFARETLALRSFPVTDFAGTVTGLSSLAGDFFDRK